jgi:rfaE bifunctional protein nucleotidyltransferase chain/domain
MLRIRSRHNAIFIRKLHANSQKTNWRFVFKKLSRHFFCLADSDFYPVSKAMNEKIITLEELAARSAELRAAGKRIVTTNGCFDLLHVGHVRYLQAARALGDVLAVGLNGDDSVRELKGLGRPVNTERDRAEILAALECVDFVTIFSEPRATRFLSAAHPAIYAKGGDYTSENLNTEERAILETIGAEIRIIPFEVGYSTSALLQRLCESEK